jgi:type IV pilus secretin PilQ/predicted competence protein
MNVHKASQMGAVRKRTTASVAAVMAIVALGVGSLMLTAAGASIRLLSVSAQSNAVVIEATEPVAYTVNWLDAQTLLVELREVSVGGATSVVQPKALVTAVRLEQGTSVDSVSVARVRLTVPRGIEYTVKSARNTIRLDLTSAAAAAPNVPKPEVAEPVAQPKPVVAVRSTAPAPPPSAPSAPAAAAPSTSEPVATTIDRVRSTRKGSSTVVTISGNGKLTPTGITESRDLPRRLIVDFPNITSHAAPQIAGDGDLVRHVRVGLNNNTPLVTRVVIEIGDTATYALQRSSVGTRDVSIVVQGGRPTPSAASNAAGDATLAASGAETISLAEAMANAAPLLPKDADVDTIEALKTVPHRQGRSNAAAASTPSPVPQTVAGDKAPQRAVQNAPATGPPPEPAPQPPPPAAPPSLAGQSQQISSGQERKYTGHPISMDFQGVDLRSVLRTFAEISGLNMVIDPDVQGTVDILLTDVPWDQALEVILRGNQLDYTVDGTIVRIAKVETLRREQDARTQLAQSAAQAGILAVRTYTLSYAKAEQAAPLIRSTVLSQRGNVQIDTRTNTLIITDLPARLDTVNQLLATIDRAEPQVEIEARIITTTRDFARTLGVQWGFNGRVNSDVGNTTGLAFPNNGSIGGRTGRSQGANDVRGNANDAVGTAVNLAAGDATSAVGIALGATNGAFNLDIALSALERSGKGRVLSTPRVTTQNNVEAEITQGVQIPVQTVANQTVTVTFKDAALSLKVTPQITASNTVIMQITVENASVGALVDTGLGRVPSIDTQRAITRVQVVDGTTTVMGGIFVSREQTTNDKTPGLYRIPFLGWLFKRDSQVDESRELLIFITPRIQRG